MRCPVDDIPMLLSERHGVEIDYCPTCRGVWLDRGELDKILDFAGAEPRSSRRARNGSMPTPPFGYDDDWDDDDRDDDRYRSGRKRKKRSSILSEIFDFD